MTKSEQTMLIRKSADKPFFKAADAFFGSKYFIALFAFATLCCNVFGLELYFYPAVCVIGVWLCLFSKDLRALIPMVLLLYVSLSLQNEPSKNSTSVFYPENGLWLIVVFAATLIVALLTRVFLRHGKGFFTYKRGLLSGFGVFAFGLCLSGLGVGGNFTLQNFRYLGLLFISLFGLYYLLLPLIDWKSLQKEYFAWSGLFLGLTVAFELVNIYMGASKPYFPDEIFREGIRRWMIFTGWGVYNNIGCMLLFCVPCAFYLCITQKNGWIYNLLGHLLFIAIIFTNSRNSILVGAVLYLACMFFVCRSPKNNIGNVIVYVCCFFAVFVGVIVFRERIQSLFAPLIEEGLHSSGRLNLFKVAWLEFLNAPVFGQGFFGGVGGTGITVGAIEMMPTLCHNTFLEMLSSCGFVGFIGYIYHRMQTVKSVLVRPTIEKAFLGLCIASLLLSCILDCHFFLIGPGLSYSIFLAILEKGNEMQGVNNLPCVRLAKEMSFEQTKKKGGF